MNKKEYISPEFSFVRVEIIDDTLSGSVEIYRTFTDDTTDWGDMGGDVLYDTEFDDW